MREAKLKTISRRVRTRKYGEALRDRYITKNLQQSDYCKVMLSQTRGWQENITQHFDKAHTEKVAVCGATLDNSWLFSLLVKGYRHVGGDQYLFEYDERVPDAWLDLELVDKAVADCVRQHNPFQVLDGDLLNVADIVFCHATIQLQFDRTQRLNPTNPIDKLSTLHNFDWLPQAGDFFHTRRVVLVAQAAQAKHMFSKMMQPNKGNLDACEHTALVITTGYAPDPEQPLFSCGQTALYDEHLAEYRDNPRVGKPSPIELHRYYDDGSEVGDPFRFAMETWIGPGGRKFQVIAATMGYQFESFTPTLDVIADPDSHQQPTYWPYDKPYERALRKAFKMRTQQCLMIKYKLSARLAQLKINQGTKTTPGCAELYFTFLKSPISVDKCYKRIY